MADSAKETSQNPPAQPTTENTDDNRRRTRSQTRNGGITPPAPVVEVRGRKRALPTPGGAKRGRKPAQPPAPESDEHSKQTQDLSKVANTEGNKDESVEMKVDEKEQASKNGEIQATFKKDDVCTPKKKQEKDESVTEENSTGSKPQAESKTESTEPTACSLPKKDEEKKEEPKADEASANSASPEKDELVHSNDQSSSELKKDEAEEKKEQKGEEEEKEKKKEKEQGDGANDAKTDVEVKKSECQEKSETNLNSL